MRGLKTLSIVGAVMWALHATTACVPVVLGGATAAGYTSAQERSMGRAVDDAGIRARLNTLYFQKDVNDLFKNVGIEVNEGRVLLTGAVKTPETKIEAARLAWKPEGVKEVLNEIQVTDKSSLEDYARDAWISAQLRTKLILAKEVRSVNYTIETVNKVVYLIGVSQSEEEMERVTDIASQIEGVDRVVSHVRLWNDPKRP